MRHARDRTFGMNVLVICTREEAKANGASMTTHHHRTSPECLFWWPELGRELLQGKRFDMVVATRPLDAELWQWLRAYMSRNDTIWVTGQLSGGLSSARNSPPS